MKFIDLPEEIAFGVNEIASLLGDPDVTVSFHKDTALTVRKENGVVSIGYSRPLEAYRGLSFAARFDGGAITQSPKFERLCIMVDCSRNAVLNLPAVKDLIVHLAMIGFTSLMLYTEDTYEIPEYPYFGHLRGRFSKEELKEIVAFAKKMDIEVIPCIQTLAHLNALTNWGAFSSIIDVNDILLADDERTYALIEAMLKNLRDCFTTPFINIGMDEAHLLGRGKHTDKFGYEAKPDIMLRHLAKVVELCKKYDFEPVMWSDMFFRMQFNGRYRVAEGELQKEVIEKIPEEVSLCYWEYNTNPNEEAALDHMFHCHQTTGRNLWFAGGCWCWSGYSPKNYFSTWVTPLQLQYAEKYGIKNIIATCWGDDGAECTVFNMLPSLLQYAEICWDKADEKTLNSRSLDCFAMSYDTFSVIDTVGYYEEFAEKTTYPPVFEKAVLYSDPLIGPMNWDIDHAVPLEKYAEDIAKLEAAMEQQGDDRYLYLFDTQYKLARLLDTKLKFSHCLRQAYRKNDKAELSRLAGTLPKMTELLEDFIEAYRFQWHQNNKPFGFEVIDIRLGGLKQRLATAQIRIDQYVNNELDRLEELEQPELPTDGIGAKVHEKSVKWRQAATANVLAW